MSTSDKIVTNKEGRVGYLIFNNPERHNAVSLEMWEKVARVLKDFEQDKEIGVVVLTGTGGKAFVSGADISKFEDERATLEAVDRYNDAVENIYSSVHAFPKPTVAMIRGYCIGGGLGLAVSCDIRIAADHSRFSLPAAKLGLGYGFPAAKRLVDVVGPSFAKEIFFTARQFDVQEAHAMQLVNRVVPDADIEGYVKEFAETIAANAPLTVNSVKFIVGEVMKDERERNLARCAELVKKCFASADYAEGRKAFMEKRKPVFVGG